MRKNYFSIGLFVSVAFTSMRLIFIQGFQVNKSRHKLLFQSSSRDNEMCDGYELFIRNFQSSKESDALESFSPVNPKEYPSSSYEKKIHSRNSERLYIRDPNDDFSKEVDEKPVMRLIQMRSKAQSNRNYRLADDLLRELNESGVYVWDKDKLWSCSPIAPRRRYNPTKGRNPSRNRNSNQFNRHGHDYIQIGGGIDTNACQLTLNEIHTLVAKRLEFKLIKRYDKADEIQRQLYHNGVRIHDKLRQWRADGGVFEDAEHVLANKPFELNSFSKPFVDDGIYQNVTKLVSLRDDCRSKQNYTEADRLRGILWVDFNVAVDDKTRTFSLGGYFGTEAAFYWTNEGPVNPRQHVLDSKRDWRIVGGVYEKSPLSIAISQDDEEEVINLIHDRLEAKRVKDFDVADIVRDHLYERYNVSVDDNLRQWSKGGLFETDSLRKSSPTLFGGKVTSNFVRVYNRRGSSGDLSGIDVTRIETMIQRRSEELSRFNRRAADFIAAQLRKDYDIVIDDENGEWNIRGNEYNLSPRIVENLPSHISHNLPNIEGMLKERSLAKFERNFSRADEIREQLHARYGITIDDRLKEWSLEIKSLRD